MQLDYGMPQKSSQNSLEENIFTKSFCVCCFQRDQHNHLFQEAWFQNDLLDYPNILLPVLFSKAQGKAFINFSREYVNMFAFLTTNPFLCLSPSFSYYHMIPLLQFGIKEMQNFSVALVRATFQILQKIIFCLSDLKKVTLTPLINLRQFSEF